MISLEFREHYELFEKTEIGLKVKFGFSFYGVFYKKASTIPKDLANVIGFDGKVAYSLYEDPSAIEYTIRIDDNGDIMLNGFWQKE